MEHDVDITVNVDGQEYELINAFYDREAGAIAYEEIRGNCARWLPRALRERIEGEAHIAAYQQEQERRQEAAEARYDR